MINMLNGVLSGVLNGGAAATVGTVLEVTGLKAGYGRIEALHGVDLRIGAGQLVALVGANGAGKTTLLKTISGVIRSAAGQVKLYGQDITGQTPDRRVRLGISQVPEGRQVFGGLTVEDNLRLGAYTRGDAGRFDDMEKMYGLFPILKEKRLLLAGMLSGGQQQMLAMARALMSRPKILLLDEPSMGLAPLLVEEIFAVIARLKKEGIPILLVEQNAQAALSIADYAYVLETGNIVTAGAGKTLLNDEKVRAAYLGM
jgi:branched-chain amino acid transport system ATP-binding protein